MPLQSQTILHDCSFTLTVLSYLQKVFYVCTFPRYLTFTNYFKFIDGYHLFKILLWILASSGNIYKLERFSKISV